jgi:hypothetical protein
MYYDWRNDGENVRYHFGAFVKADDEALRILNIVKYEMKRGENFDDRMRAVREVLILEGHEVPFRIGGYRRVEL